MTSLTNLSERDKVSLYQSSDFFISLSDNPQETFGLTLLEAMACGLALVVSDFDGYREIVTDDIGRRIRTTWGGFEPLAGLAPLMDEITYHRYLSQSLSVDVEGLADALAFLFSNPHQCREMGKKARDRFSRLYDHPVVIPELERLWLKLKEDFVPDPIEAHVDPLAMNVFECFSHYVTQTLTPDMMVELSDHGHALLESGTKYPLLSEMGNLIDHEEVETIMNQTIVPCSVEDTLAAHDGEEWKRYYLVLWMLKHGLLRLAGYGA